MEDIARLLLTHDRNNWFCDVHHAEEVYVDLLAEIFDINVLDRCGVGVSGIVDNDIDAAELFMAGLHGCNDLVVVGDIKSNGAGSFSAVFLDEAGKLLLLARGGNYGVSVAKGGLGDGEAQGHERSR